MERLGSRKQFWVAITITLALHAIVLLALAVQPLRSEPLPVNKFVEIDFADEASMEVFEEQ